MSNHFRVQKEKFLEQDYIIKYGNHTKPWAFCGSAWAITQPLPAFYYIYITPYPPEWFWIRQLSAALPSSSTPTRTVFSHLISRVPWSSQLQSPLSILHTLTSIQLNWHLLSTNCGPRTLPRPLKDKGEQLSPLSSGSLYCSRIDTAHAITPEAQVEHGD